MKEPKKITYSELMKELENHRCNPAYPYTEQQDQFLLKARNNPRPVPYPVLVKLWIKAGWKVVTIAQIKGRWLRLQNGKLGQKNES